MVAKHICECFLKLPNHFWKFLFNVLKQSWPWVTTESKPRERSTTIYWRNLGPKNCSNAFAPHDQWPQLGMQHFFDGCTCLTSIGVSTSSQIIILKQLHHSKPPLPTLFPMSYWLRDFLRLPGCLLTPLVYTFSLLLLSEGENPTHCL